MVNRQDACRVFGITEQQWSTFRARLEAIIDEDNLSGGQWQVGTPDRDAAINILLQRRPQIFPPPFPRALRVGNWSREQTSALMCLATQAKSNLIQKQRRGRRQPGGVTTMRTPLPELVPLEPLSPPPAALSQSTAADSELPPLPLRQYLVVVRFDCRRHHDAVFFSLGILMEGGSTTVTVAQLLRHLRKITALVHGEYVMVKANGEWGRLSLARESVWQTCLEVNQRLQTGKIMCKVGMLARHSYGTPDHFPLGIRC